ncbi:MAG: ABC transporter ATP-binding protein [Acidimicrobiia bacterium]|nr:ABC transporter ATP-binding protein [Acidimicrobiia bacterium]
MPLLEVSNLSIAVQDIGSTEGSIFVEPYGPWLPEGFSRAIADLSFSIERGEVLAIVGESGAGKSISALGSLGLLSAGAVVTGGTVHYDGTRLRPTKKLEKKRSRWWRRNRTRKRIGFMEELADDGYRQVLGTRIGVLFQDAVASWDPATMIGDQAGEVLDEHTDMSQDEIVDRVLEALGEVQLPKVSKYVSFRHEMSRGQAQRAMIAAALVKGPDLLVADEPLSGLDPPVAAAVLEILRDLKEKRGMAMILITHDLATVASTADRVMVMYGGQIVEQGPVDEIFYRPRHPYTEGLLGSVPSISRKRLVAIEGTPPRIQDVAPDRCAFAERCQYAVAQCVENRPPSSRSDHRLWHAYEQPS